jgi:ribosomal protein L40E
MNSEPSTDSQQKSSDSSLQPWQFFVLAALGCATAVTFLVRNHGVVPVILLSVMMGTTALVGLAALRVVRPLLSPQDERGAVVGQRLRVLLEQDKALALRTIKELEFDRAMGKISEEDFHEMSHRLRARAARLMKQLDAGGGYRAQIERDLAKRLGAAAEKPERAAHVCVKCSTQNDADARFCKNCGAQL